MLNKCKVKSFCRYNGIINNYTGTPCEDWKVSIWTWDLKLLDGSTFANLAMLEVRRAVRSIMPELGELAETGVGSPAILSAPDTFAFLKVNAILECPLFLLSVA
jgi:hypothetical protein